MEALKYIGMDVHTDTIVIAVLNARGKLVMESVSETTAPTVRDFVQGIRGTVHVTFEEGTRAAWLYDILRPLVAKVVVCNPRKNTLLLAGNKGDRIDAQKLAQLLSHCGRGKALAFQAPALAAVGTERLASRHERVSARGPHGL